MVIQSSLNILLIEDNSADARYLEELLREAMDHFEHAKEGQRVDSPTTERIVRSSPQLHHETTLAAGMDRLDEPIDVVLLDLNLPDSRGLETLSTLSDGIHIPIIVLTGLRGRETGIAAIRRGADDFLVKDKINSELLIRSIYHAIERRSKERDLRRYETIIEVSSDVNTILDLDGSIQYVTPSVESVLGYAPSDLIGMNVFEHIHPDDRDAARRGFHAVIEREDYPPIEFRIKHGNGSWVVLESQSKNLLHDPLIEGIVVYTRDITERMEREQKLEQFATVVSHDLRNPLGIAQMYFGMLEDEVDDSSTFETVERSLARMETIIDTLLTLSRDGASIADPEPVWLPSVIERAWWQVDTFDATLYVGDVTETILADEERLQTVIENLFRNAVEHGGHAVDIHVDWLGDGLSFEDTGGGIPSDVFDEVFEFGYSTGGGTGAGLAIVHEIIEAHGWEITVDNTPNSGARFEIRGMETASKDQ